VNVFACSKNSGRDHGRSGSNAHIAEDRKCAQGKRQKSCNSGRRRISARGATLAPREKYNNGRECH
jgi:hypothetical protein